MLNKFKLRNFLYWLRNGLLKNSKIFPSKCITKEEEEESYQIVKVISIYFILNIMLLLLKLLQYYDLVCIFVFRNINLMGHCIEQ